MIQQATNGVPMCLLQPLILQLNHSDQKKLVGFIQENWPKERNCDDVGQEILSELNEELVETDLEDEQDTICKEPPKSFDKTNRSASGIEVTDVSQAPLDPPIHKLDQKKLASFIEDDLTKCTSHEGGQEATSALKSDLVHSRLENDRDGLNAFDETLSLPSLDEIENYRTEDIVHVGRGKLLDKIKPDGFDRGIVDASQCLMTPEKSTKDRPPATTPLKRNGSLTTLTSEGSVGKKVRSKLMFDLECTYAKNGMNQNTTKCIHPSRIDKTLPISDVHEGGNGKNIEEKLPVTQQENRSDATNTDSSSVEIIDACQTTSAPEKNSQNKPEAKPLCRRKRRIKRNIHSTHWKVQTKSRFNPDKCIVKKLQVTTNMNQENDLKSEHQIKKENIKSSYKKKSHIKETIQTLRGLIPGPHQSEDDFDFLEKFSFVKNVSHGTMSKNRATTSSCSTCKTRDEEQEEEEGEVNKMFEMFYYIFENVSDSVDEYFKFCSKCFPVFFKVCKNVNRAAMLESIHALTTNALPSKFVCMVSSNSAHVRFRIRSRRRCLKNLQTKHLAQMKHHFDISMPATVTAMGTIQTSFDLDMITAEKIRHEILDQVGKKESNGIFKLMLSCHQSSETDDISAQKYTFTLDSIKMDGAILSDIQEQGNTTLHLDGHSTPSKKQTNISTFFKRV